MRYLGLDIGDRRIGVAISDPCHILSRPLTAIIRDNDENAISSINMVVQENKVVKIIVGLPYTLNGTIGEQAKKVVAFTNLLSQAIGVEIKFQDERLSTVSASNLLSEAGIKSVKKKGRIDSAAAAIILQGYLDSQITNSS